MTFSFTGILLIIYIFFFFLLSYKWMESIKKYQTALRIVWGMLYTVCFFSFEPILPEENGLREIFIYSALLIPIVYGIISSYTSLSRYSKYLDEGIYSFSIFLIFLILMGMMAVIWDYTHYSVWDDLSFWKLSSLWIFAHIPFFISSKNRKWFFHRFYLFLVIIIFIWGLFEYDLYESIIWMSYGVFFIVYIVAILIGKYIQIHLERK